MLKYLSSKKRSFVAYKGQGRLSPLQGSGQRPEKITAEMCSDRIL